ncbi:AMP-binding protein [Acholeplasma sp. OttesenSCG-928-E16]|nr:AMP-binding protein [Acholeplasma sp. OttesenSCG-928-E16]
MSEWRKIDKKLRNSKKTLESLFELTMSTFNNKVAFEEVVNGNIIIKTFDDIKEEAILIANNLKQTKNKEMIAINLKNQSIWVSLFFGILMSGNYPLLVSDEEILSNIEASEVICEDNILLYMQQPATSTNSFSWSDTFYFHTSGTTGKHKIIEFNGKKLVDQILNTRELIKINGIIKNYSMINKIKLFAFLPFSHVFGFIAGLMWFFTYGKTFVVNNTKNFLEMKKTIIEHKVTHLFGVPVMFESVVNQIKKKLLSKPKRKQEAFDRLINFSINLQSTLPRIGNWIARNILFRGVRNQVLGSNLKVMISGGSSINNDTLKILNGIGYHLFNGYGLTEIGIVSVNLSKKANKRIDGSVGVPFKTYDFFLDENNQLSIKYQEDKDFFTTNDFFKNQNGLVFQYRKDDIIKNKNGIKISLSSIEKKISGPFIINKTVIFDEENDEILVVLKIKDNLGDFEIKTIKNSLLNSINSLKKEEYISKIYLTSTMFYETISKKPRKEEILTALKNSPQDFLELKHLNDSDTISINDEMMNEIIIIFGKVLNINKEDISPSSSFNLDLNGNSFDYYSLIYGINEKFEIEIKFNENEKLETPEDFYKYLKKHYMEQYEKNN